MRGVGDTTAADPTPAAAPMPAPVPTSIAEVTVTSAKAKVCETAQPLTMPKVQASRAEARPPVAVAARGDQARAKELRGLDALGTQLSAALTGHAVRSADLLEIAANALATAQYRFSPSFVGERALCKVLQDWAAASRSESPGVSAESLVVAHFPDFQSATQGAFKSVARAMDQAIAARSAEQKTDAQIRGFLGGMVLGGHFDAKNAAEKLGKEAGVAVGRVASLVSLPLAGLVTLRDLSALIRQRLNGRPISNLEIASEAAATFSMFRLEKIAVRAAPTVIAKAAELNQIAKAGLQKIAEASGLEGAQRLTRALRELMVLRAELIARLEAVAAHPGTNRVVREAIEKALKSLRNNGKVDDIVGALRDLHRVPVWDQIKVREFNHLEEVLNHAAALMNARRVIFAQVGIKRCELVQIMDDLKIYRDNVVAVLEKKR